MADSCEHTNEYSGSIKYGEFFDYLSTYQFLKKKSVPRCLSVTVYSKTFVSEAYCLSVTTL
jgi:hypothetical protein